MRPRRLTFPALLALAACQQPANDANIAIDNGAATKAAIETLPPSEEAGLPATVAVNAAAVMPTAIPALFRGRWGAVPADCTSTRGDAKGLLTIDERTLKFFEAKGTISRVLAAPAPNRFDAAYDYSGEGMTWQRVERLSVTGARLERRSDAHDGEPAEALTYTRCS